MNLTNIIYPIVPHDLIQIYWIDAKSYTEWRSHSDLEENDVSLCCSTGYVIKETVETILIASDISFDDNGTLDSIGNSITIPKSLIVKSTTI
jgi:hypothetical protein|tara:strand:+ start:392 stop:667 length:276 start_codon:yes stop_codon:yes gene_type:complete